jgi:hypothetical protein
MSVRTQLARQARQDRTAALADLARFIRGPRPIVGRAFEDVAAGHRATMSLEGIAGEVVSDVEAYVRAVERADEAGWLVDFCAALMNADAVKDGFAQKATVLGPTGGVNPQATYDADKRSFHPLVQARLQLEAAPQLCRIDIDGEAKGTGFLVRPHLVLTGYHVVSKLIVNGKIAKDSEQRLVAVFDDMRDLRGSILTRLPEVHVPVAPAWLVGSSHCLPIEELGVSPDDDTYADAIHITDGPWDYALIRLQRIVNPTHAGLRLGTMVSPTDQIVVFHHPKGKSLVGSHGEVVCMLGRSVRFKHTANTKDGSSGGPCFNSMFEVVGIHQAGPRSAAIRGKRVPNRAIPIHPFREKIQAHFTQQPPAELTPILVVDRDHPVIGRDATQDWIWHAVPKDSPAGGSAGNKILVVRGTTGRGKKFTVEILRTMLKDGPHMLVDLDAGNMVEDTPVTLAQKILAAVNADASRLPANESLTTDLTWIKFKLMQEIRSAIDAVRNNRTLWVAIHFPETGVLPRGSKIRETLDALYGQVLQVDWLRLVLLGLKVELPHEVRAVSTVEPLKALTAADVMTYFERRWAKPTGVANSANLRNFVEQQLISSVPGANDDPPPPEYHKELVSVLRKFERLLGAMMGGGQ